MVECGIGKKVLDLLARTVLYPDSSTSKGRASSEMWRRIPVILFRHRAAVRADDIIAVNISEKMCSHRHEGQQPGERLNLEPGRSIMAYHLWPLLFPWSSLVVGFFLPPFQGTERNKD